MIFKNKQLGVGDYVAFQASSVPLPEVQAVVIRVEDGVLEVLSTLLIPFQHDGRFSEDEVARIEVVYPAEVAIPKESRGKGFSKNQYVSVRFKDGSVCRGRVVAAFDGLVVARREDDELVTAGSSFFEEIPKWRQIDSKMMLGIGTIGKLIRKMVFAKGDIGKFYVMAADGRSGKVMTLDEMYALEIDEIGGWYKIGQLDVPPQ